MKSIKIELKWALIFSVAVLLWLFLEKISGLHGRYIDYHLYLTNLFYIPAILLIVLALKDKKKTYYKGEMSYIQGFLSGIILTLLITLFSPLTQWVTTYLITTEYFPNVIKRSVELGYYNTIQDAENYFNYKNYAIQGAIGMLVMGVVIVAIAMVFIRTKKIKN
ncbi:MAG: DUF4199 domain-containing protein [Bacteroidaceae bacterium]|nr:DUF4199 domain-containing protein [Bacteroidaceae bacterium]MEA5099852.1 DUF4199 domain-containing protein [Bacteroidales bacterium]